MRLIRRVMNRFGLLSLRPERDQLEMIWPHSRRGAPPAEPLAQGYRIRQFCDEDEPAYQNLLLESEMIACPLGYWRNHVLPGGFFVVEEEATGDLVATGMASHHPSPRHPRAGNLGWIATHPRHRGRRLGWAVSAAVTRRLLEGGYSRMYLTTDDDRIAAIATYLKIGWRPFIFSEDMRGRWTEVFRSLDLPFEPDDWIRQAKGL